MNQALSPKQKVVLTEFRSLQEKLGYSPTLEELRQSLGYSHTSAVQRHIDALKDKGYLTADKHHKRSLELLHQHLVNIPLVGNVACGMPLLAEENVEAYIPYDADKLHGTADDYFFLRAAGDSMNRTGIDDGDLVLVKQQQTAEPGKSVVALIGDDATVKRLVNEDGYWVLQPVSNNPVHKKLIMVEDFAILGVAVDVVKTGETTNGKRRSHT